MTSVDGKSEQRPSSEKLVTVIFNSSTLISRRVGGGSRGLNELPLKINTGGRKSTMRRLNNYMRCTIRESRMSALVLNAYQI